MNILSKKMSLIDFVFSKLRTPKTSLDKCLKSLISDYMSTGNIVNKPKHFSNLHGRTFIWLIDFVFPKLRTLKTWLDKCLESLVSENISKSNMGKEPRHCFSQHHSTFIIFMYQCQGNWLWASLLYWHVKSWDFLLKHWLPMRSILFLIRKI